MPITVVATGDTIAARRLPARGAAGASELQAIVAGADVSFTNLEIVLNEFVGPATDWFNLSAEPAIAQDLRDYGFDVVSFANNHALNYGAEGVRLTLDALRAAQLPWAGAGRNLHEARRPRYIDVPAGRVALIAASSTFVPGQQATHQRRDCAGRAGINPLRFAQTYLVDGQALDELRRIARQVGPGHPHRALVNRAGEPGEHELDFLGHRFGLGEEGFGLASSPDAEDVREMLAWVEDARWSADLVIVSVHCHESGGTRYEPPDFLVAFAHACIDAGADAFIGHGPHRLRGIEIYRARPIFYSLANFIYEPEYVMSLPGERYLRPDQADWLPTRFHAQFERDAEEWDSIVPVMRFEDRHLVELRIVPITLEGPMPGRGTPRLAGRDAGDRILRRFAELSAPFGTALTIDSGEARVTLSAS